MKTQFDKDELKVPPTVKDIFDVVIKVGDKVACAQGAYKGSCYLAYGEVIKINSNISVKVKVIKSAGWKTDINVPSSKIMIIG